MSKSDNLPETLKTGPVVGSAEQSQVQAVDVGGVSYEVVQAVNVPTLKHETGQTIAIKIDGPILVKTNHVEKKVTIDGEIKTVTEAVELSVVRVIELQTGGLFTYPLNAISAANLIDAYPDNGYIGKSFAIRKGGVVAGKRYKDVQIVEITPKA